VCVRLDVCCVCVSLSLPPVKSTSSLSLQMSQTTTAGYARAYVSGAACVLQCVAVCCNV